MRNRRIAFLLGAAMLLVLAARHPSADFRIMTQHDATDRAPHRFQAAVDLGLMGVSVLVTWTGRHLG